MSTDQQLRGDSLRRQADLSRRWADQHGLVLDESLRDIGVSAYRGKNRRDGALGKFLGMVEMGRVKAGSYLLVESLDRLSRDQVLEALNLFLAIIRAGITIVTLADGQTYSQETVGNDWSKLIISLTIMARAHEESLRKSERVRQSYAARLSKAWAGNLNMSCRVPFWINAKRIDRERIQFALNEHATTVRRMYDLAANGLSRHAIAKSFNAAGVATLKDGNHGWNAAVINRILDGRESLGEYQAQRRVDGKRILVGEPIPGYFPPVVDNAVWLKARANKRKRGENTGRKGIAFANLFVGMGRCVHCRGAMTLHRSTQSLNRTSTKDRVYSRSYLSCSNRRRGKLCSGPTKSFKYDIIENAILSNVHEFMLSDIMRTRREMSPIAEIENRIAQLVARIEDCSRREENLLNQLEDADEALPLVMSRLKERQREKTSLQENLMQFEKLRISAELDLMDEVSEADIKQLREQWEDASPDHLYAMRAQVHAALRTFIDFISFDASEGTATVVVLNGLRAYQFIDGELTGKYDLTHQLGHRATGKIDPRVFLTDGRTYEVDKDRAEALHRIRSNAQ
ncbi:hypothetical protein BK022_19820 [Methylorubrum extorquens]|uniref:Recombinase domain-containing protein n=1 Tax=Methylorubrum extorquens TaxID=408 RepID=A0A1S1NXA5_METEX|nr:hypothetical protein BK022_19820 [Methylorubrum extorquens]